MFLNPHRPLLHWEAVCPSGSLREKTSVVSAPKQEISEQKAFCFKDIDKKEGFN